MGSSSSVYDPREGYFLQTHGQKNGCNNIKMIKKNTVLHVMFRNYASCTLDMCADKTVVENFEKVFIALSDDWQALMAVRAIRSLITIAVANIYIYI